LIEAKALYKQSFGFDKGQSEPVPTGGKKPIELYTDLASDFFGIADGTSENYTEEDLPELAAVVKNRISR
jgi:hypothetical protein